MTDDHTCCDDGMPDSDDSLFGGSEVALTAGPALASLPVPAPAPAPVSGVLKLSCAGSVALHTASLASRGEDTEEEAQSRADLAAKAVRKAICNAARAGLGAWKEYNDPVTALESLLYLKSNDTTREAVDSVANIVQSPLAPRATLEAVDDILVHASQRLLPVDGGYGPSFPIAGACILVEGRGDAAPPPRVTLTFPLSDPHFPLRCARIEIVKLAGGFLRVTAHQEGDRRLPAPTPGVAIGPEEGSRVLSDASVERLFAPSQSPAVRKRRILADWWIGLHNINLGLQRRTSEGSPPNGTVRAYVLPGFLTHALAHLATQNLRLHVVANAAAIGQGGKPSRASLWRSVALDMATLYARPMQGEDDHAFYLRAPLHKTFCGCLCGAYAPLSRGGHADVDGCQPCLDIYLCGRKLVDGRCPVHAANTRGGAHNVCVARTSLRLKCVHGTDNAPPTVSTEYATYNSLDHELLLAPMEKNIVRDIAASAVHLCNCAAAADAHAVIMPTEALATPEYLCVERDRLDCVLSGLYQKNDEGERTDTADSHRLHGVEWFERHAQLQSCKQQSNTPTLQTLDEQATKLLCEGNVTVEIGDDWQSTRGSFPDCGKLRVRPQIARMQGVAKLWRRSVKAGDARTRLAVKNAKDIEYIYGRLFEHRNAPRRY